MKIRRTPHVDGPASVQNVTIPAVPNLADIRGYELSVAPFDRPEVTIEQWFRTLGEFLDEHDRENRYVIVIDSDDPPYVLARDIRVGTETNHTDRPFDLQPPLTTLQARLDFLDDAGGEDGVDLVDVRAIGRVAD